MELAGLLTDARIEALGWTLVHFLWQGCVLAFVYWLVCVFSKEESASFRYWAGMTVYFTAGAAAIFTYKSYYLPPVQFSSSPLASEALNANLVMSGGVPDLWTLAQQGVEPALPWVVVLWSLGVLFLGVRTASGWWSMRRQLRSGVPLQQSDIVHLAQRLADVIGVKQSVRVLQSAAVAAPMVIGWLKPVVLLPASLITGLPREQLQMVLAHELAHVRRFDYLFNLFQVVMDTLLFFHPAMRWISRRVRQERELCCDDLVVRVCGRRVVYAKALANVAEMSVKAPAVAVGANGGELFQRVRRIVDRELPRNSSGYAQLSLMAVVALVVSVSAQQGLAVQRALESIATSAVLQSSDFGEQARRQAREAWASGVARLPDVQRVSLAERETGLQIVEQQPVTLRSTPIQEIPVEPVSQSTTESRVENPAEKVAQQQPPFEPVLTLVKRRAEFQLDSLPPPPAPRVVYEPREAINPQYPWKARRQGVEGFVQLEFSLNSKGKATGISVVDAIPAEVFDKAAIRALKKWRFNRDQLPEEDFRIRKTFQFSLAEEQELVDRRRCQRTGRRTCTMSGSNALVLYVNRPISRSAAID